MHDLDITQVALVGISASRKNTIHAPVEQRCAGCRVHVYLSRPAMNHARKQAAAQGQKTIIVCDRCVKPWLDDVVKNGGEILASEKVMEEDVIPAMQQAEKDWGNRN